MNGWTEAYFWPDFNEYGFHTGKFLDVKLADGCVLTCVVYQGQGIFGAGDGLQDVAQWRPHICDTRVDVVSRVCANS